MPLTLYRPSLRAIGAIGVLASWAGSLAWLANREFGRNEAASLSIETSLRLAPSGAWYAVYSGDVPVGNASVTLDTLSPGFRIVETFTLESPGPVGLMASTRRTATYLRQSLDMDSVRSRYGRVGREVSWFLGSSGDTLSAHSGTGDTKAQGRARFERDPVPASAFSYRLAMAGRLVADRSRNFPLIDAWPIAGRKTSLDVGHDSMVVFADSTRFDTATQRSVAVRRDSIRALPVTVDGAALPYRVWLDHRGTLIGMETLFGVRWVRTDFDEAVTSFRKRLTESTPAIRGAFPILAALAGSPGVSDTGTHYRYFLAQHRDGSLIDRSLLEALGGGRQAVHGDTIIVREDSWQMSFAQRQDAAADPMIQQEAAAIVGFARRFSAGVVDTMLLSRMITAIHEAVRVDTSIAAPDDALRTLAGHHGRPDGVARLFVAVARAAGLQARYVIGVAPKNGALYTHAWAEVWGAWGGSNSSGWYAVDPVSGHVRAATDLIRLGYGGSSHPEDMLPLLSNARITEVRSGVQP